jgi:hypothetical protein
MLKNYRFSNEKCRKSKNCKIFNKNMIFSKLRNFPKLQISNLAKNIKFRPQIQIWPKISKLDKNFKIGQKIQIWSKISNLVKNIKFGQKFEIWSKI